MALHPNVAAAIVGVVFVALALAGGVGVLPLSATSVGTSNCPGFLPSVCPNLWFSLQARNFSGYLNGTFIPGITINSLSLEVALPSQTSCFGTLPTVSFCSYIFPVSYSAVGANSWSSVIHTALPAALQGSYYISAAIVYSSTGYGCPSGGGCTNQLIGTPIAFNVSVPSPFYVTPGCGVKCPTLTPDFSYTQYGLQLNVTDRSNVSGGASIVKAASVWSWGDGSTVTYSPTTASHTYAHGGSYLVSEFVAANYNVTGISNAALVRTLQATATYNITVLPISPTITTPGPGGGGNPPHVTPPLTFAYGPLVGLLLLGGLTLLLGQAIAFLRGNVLVLVAVSAVVGFLGYGAGVVVTGRFF